MAKIDKTFGDLCQEILRNGRDYENKNRGVTRKQIPSYTFRHSFKDGFPLLTNKKVPFRMIVGELLWFLRGDTDVKYLNDNNIPIWNKDAYNWYKKHCPSDTLDLTFEEFCERGTGSVGQNYSAQWRNFNGKTDQIKDLLIDMSKDIMSSRLKVNAWNPSEIFETALPPCHSEFQVIGVPLTLSERVGYYQEINKDYVVGSVLGVDLNKLLEENNIPEFGFELHWNQRSVDTFLGLPFNIASYATLAKLLEKITGYPALGIEGTLKCVHFYDNQFEAVDELLTRDPNKHPNCEMVIDTELVINDTYKKLGLDTLLSRLYIDNFKTVGYTSDTNIKVEMLAPKEL